MSSQITSAGGLITRFRNDIWEVVLVGSGVPTVWRIPKGMQIKGESIEQTAIREALEETGLRGRIVKLIGIGSWTYQYGDQDWDETCYFYLMQLDGGNIGDHDAEYERVEWVSLERSPIILHYRIEKEIAQKAATVLVKYDQRDFGYGG